MKITKQFDSNYVLAPPQKPDTVPGSGLQRKRLSSEGAAPAKRKHSPIRFESSGDSTLSKEKRDTITYYTPPRDQFSKKFSNGGGFESYQSRKRGGRGGRGFRRGRGNRGGRRW